MLAMFFYTSVNVVLQAEHERQSEIQEADRQRALVQCREEMMQLIGSSDISAVPVNEEWIRKKYSKETEQIKVTGESRRTGSLCFTFRSRCVCVRCCKFVCIVCSASGRREIIGWRGRERREVGWRFLVYPSKFL